MSKQPLNIIYLHSHDTGRYISPYGFAMPTPNLQSFAEQGVLFRQAFCTGPTCSPSRGGLLTGQTPHSCGQFGLAHRGFELRDRDKHLARVLRDNGYHCALFGVHHEVRDPLTVGYHEFSPVPEGGDVGNAENTCDFLAAKPDKPFFLSVGFINTHRKFPEAGPDDDPRYCRPPLPLPDTPETRQDMATYMASVRILDRVMGQVIKAVDDNGLTDNTLVIVTTDHGIAFPFMKCNLTDHGIGVMLMMRGPEGFNGGKVVDGMVSHVDVAPTILDLAGLDKPDWYQGTSVRPLVTGSAKEIHDAIYSEVNYHAAYEPMRCARTPQWKYIRRYNDYTHPVRSNIDASPSKDLVLDKGFNEHEYAGEELYDLIFDPNEACNRVNDPNYAKALAEMRALMDTWQQETEDHILKGHIPAPAGSLVSEQTDMNPDDVRSK